MKVTPVNFCGKFEILNLTRRFAPLKKEEEAVRDLALEIHEASPDITNDGVYCTKMDDKLMAEYRKALKALSMPSTFGFHCAVDTLNAPIYKANASEKSQLKEISLEIAKNSPGVSKYDIFNNWNVLTKI